MGLLRDLVRGSDEIAVMVYVVFVSMYIWSLTVSLREVHGWYKLAVLVLGVLSALFLIWLFGQLFCLSLSAIVKFKVR
jgi:hypothetical protein